MARSSVEIVARGKDARLATETGCEHVQLSRRARRLQPFCTDCGSTDELQLDHMAHLGARRGREGGPAQGTPEAWSVVPVTAVVEPLADARTTRGKGPVERRSGPLGKAQRPLHRATSVCGVDKR